MGDHDHRSDGRVGVEVLQQRLGTRVGRGHDLAGAVPADDGRRFPRVLVGGLELLTE